MPPIRTWVGFFGFWFLIAASLCVSFHCSNINHTDNDDDDEDNGMNCDNDNDGNTTTTNDEITY